MRDTINCCKSEVNSEYSRPEASWNDRSYKEFPEQEVLVVYFILVELIDEKVVDDLWGDRKDDDRDFRDMLSVVFHEEKRDWEDGESNACWQKDTLRIDKWSNENTEKASEKKKDDNT